MGKKEDFGRLAFYYYLNTNAYNYAIFSDSYGETFSDKSFCAFSSVIHKNDKDKFYKYFVRPTCYEMFCSERSLTIKINEQYIVCPREGGYINIGGNYMGHLLCSDYNLISSQTVPCNNMFDCVDKKSQMKWNYTYDYKPFNVSTQILLPGDTTTFNKSYEESDDGKCPKDCSECYEYGKCFECKDGQYYVGMREDDLNPIKCNSTKPEGPYYEKNRTHYFHCIEHCMKCNTPDKCLQCEPEFRLNINGKCEERIEGCEKYNISSEYNDTQTNNGYPGYKICEKCNNSRGYYCFNSDRTICKLIDDDNNTYFNNSLGCMEKCDSIGNFPNCYSCTKEACTNCQTGYYLNNQKNCLKKIENCLNDTINSNISKCDKCRDNYRCLNNDKTKCNYISNLNIYYYIDEHIDNDCMKLCSETYDKKCINCTNIKCENCINGFFVHENILCVESLENCTKHYYNKTTNIKYCEECSKDNFCINNNKSKCLYIPPEEQNTYANLLIGNVEQILIIK